jgi:LysM repeat protein
VAPVTTLKTGGSIQKLQKGNYIVKSGDTLSKIAK